ncbi:hypothetical protein B5V46_17105 [Rhodovulum sp. MB263]|nr:hypothetical protein B5V46_17105 [Rhodovulum sp. MB263]
MTDFFHGIDKIAHEGPDSPNPLAFRHYDPDALVLGKRMEDHLRFAGAYWHSLSCARRRHPFIARAWWGGVPLRRPRPGASPAMRRRAMADGVTPDMMGKL